VRPLAITWSAGIGAGSFFRCNQKRLSWAMDPPQPAETAQKIDRRQIVMHGAAVTTAALTLLPKFAAAYTDAARSTEPLVIAVPEILPGTADEGEIAHDMTQVVVGDLRQSGRFRLIDPAAAGKIADVDIVPNFATWRALGVRALVTGRVGREQQRLRTEFRLWDVEAGQHLFGELHFAAPEEWRKVGHVIADSILEHLTGERGHFAD
jgi:Tol biopolymer transport system component